MRRAHKRIGFWLAVVFVGWYAAGNLLLGALATQTLRTAHNQHQDTQSFAMDDIDTLEVSATGEQRGVQLNLIMDADSRIAHIVNPILALEVKGHTDAGTLQLSLARVSESVEGFGQKIDLHVPDTVSTIRFNLVGTVNLSSQGTAHAASLALAMTGCMTRLIVTNYTATRLQVNASCDAPDDNRTCCSADAGPAMQAMASRQHPSVQILKDVHVHDFALQMVTGDFHYMGTLIPDQVELQLGDHAVVSANSLFLKKIRFDPLPPAAVRQ